MPLKLSTFRCCITLFYLASDEDLDAFKESLPFSVGAMRWLVWFVSYGPFSSLLKSYAKNAEGEALRSSSIFYGGSERGEAKILEVLEK